MSGPPAAGGPVSFDGRGAEVLALGPTYRRVQDYLAGLPRGLSSYPECKARQGVMETIVSSAPRFTAGAPPLVTDLLSSPLTPWVPEVVLVAGILAMADRARWTDAELLEWHRSLNRHMFRGPVYRAVMAFFSPRFLLERGAGRWATFHAGSTLEVAAAGERGAVARLEFPPNLFNRLLLQVFGEALAAALENARAGKVVIQLNEATEKSGTYLASW
jgi:hypothetical protein